MRMKLISCKVLSREIGELSALSPNTIDITWIRQGYHNEPGRLREILQQTIDKIDSGDDFGTGDREIADIDAICLGYGLCSNGVTEISSARYPLVIPKVHDCISLFLGSAERYKRLFDEMSGSAYWYTPGWIEHAIMPSRELEKKTLEKYTVLYGEDNAKYLADMENTWYKDYKYAAYIRPHNENYPDFSGYTKDAAAYFGWEYTEHKGDISLLKALCSGEWDERFLIVPPGKKAVQSFDDGVIKVAD